MVYHSFVLVALFLAIRVSAQSAWNGHVDEPGTGSSFTPYFVPRGYISIDDTDPSIQYAPVGSWFNQEGSQYVNKTMHTTNRSLASTTLSFIGVGIQWFASTSSNHGFSDVYLDGKLYGHIDSYSAEWKTHQCLFSIDHLDHGHHNIRIVNTGRKRAISKGTWLDVDAFVINPGDEPLRPLHTKLFTAASKSDWSLIQKGETGVHAMQITVISETHALIIDKVEHNPLYIHGHPTWAGLFNFQRYTVAPLEIHSNSFCAGGSFLSNGTLINVGGNPVVEDKTGAADFGDIDGLQAIRLFHPCPAGDASRCTLQEYPSRIHLASPRWYNTVVRLDDGSAMIIGGSLRGGWINNATTNNPTIEYYPPKNINGFFGAPVPSIFLRDTLNSNLFPISFLLPDGRVFMAANNDAMIYDWRTNTEHRLPNIPNGVRVTYPMTGTGLLLPLSPENSYSSTVLICGGSSIDDKKPGYEINSQDPASNQCSRIELTSEGIARGWETETMPQARIMPDAVLLPTGKVLIVNGGESGIAGYGNVVGQVGYSNADNPAFTPVLYDPNAPAGMRFSTDGLPTSSIPRLYHSVASLVPDGRIMIAGSNPNLDRSAKKYATEYRVEWLSPSWLPLQVEQDQSPLRPIYKNIPPKISYGQVFTLTVDLDSSQPADIQVSLMDLGFVTHSVHMNSRLVLLKSSLSEDGQKLQVQAPPSAKIYPPGPAYVYLVIDGRWSTASKVIVGDGRNPPEDSY